MTSVEASLRALSDELGLKIRQLLHVVRVAVTGAKVSPPLFETIVILGRERTLARLAAQRAGSRESVTSNTRFIELAEVSV